MKRLKRCAVSGSVPGTRQIARRLLGWVQQGAFISVVSRIEVLGFSQPEPEQIRARTFLSLFRGVVLGEDIEEKTISVRRRHSMNVPDAIIAATALDLGLPLVTRNTAAFKTIDGLSFVNPFES